MGFFNFFTGEQPRLVEQAVDNIKAMLDIGHGMFANAAAHLLDNEILDVDLIAQDDNIDECEQAVRRAVLEHLSVDPNRELILSLKIISIVHEAERIGDLTKTLVRTADLAHKPRMGALVEPLRHARDRILQMFDLTRQGFVEGDALMARQLMREHEQTKNGLATYLQQLADLREITPNEGVVYALAARTMSRVSSHLANIASTVVCPFDQIRGSLIQTET
ncbi:MAG: PhoU domain-containing protein [Rhodothermales bacterium]